MDRKTVILMTVSSSAWLGGEALWITVAGRETAAESKTRSVPMITSDRKALPQEVLDYHVGSYFW